MLWRRALAATPRARAGASLVRASSTHAWATVEAKWQQRWAADATRKLTKADVTSDTTKPTYYCLSQFPYPSGQLHIGHVRVYTISDTLARLKRMQGYDVLHPMGWDAFGLPAENAAIERGISPADWTVQNIAQAKAQLQSLGIRLDWDREVTTCAPDYYKWTQWIFLQLYEQGLAYRKEALVNWDPVDQTVLANEQVDAEGRSWRSGAIVEQRLLNQWFLRITDYADRLLDDLDRLDKWPDAVKRMQAAWIGRSKGSRVQFGVATEAEAAAVVDVSLPVFTTRVDTLFGVSFVSLAPEASFVDALLPHVPSTHRADVDAYIARVSKLTKDERAKGETTSGVFTGLYAVHPITEQKLPLYLAEYVLPQYGTGVVMGVPAHDERDFAFAQHHGLPIQRVLAAADDATDDASPVVTGHGVLEHSGAFSGLPSADAISQINAWLQQHGLGEETTQFRLRDWLVSRQRYWGAPVPVIHCKQCGPVGVPSEDLPVTLPPMDGGDATTSESLKGGDGESPLARMAAWRACTCPQCGGAAERDTDTLDTFVDSSWYFLRYCDARNDTQAFTRDAVDKWMKHNGVDMYVGGIEHAILHLLYSRFFTKFLYDQQLVSTDEPFTQLLAQGMVLGKTYKAAGSLRYLKPDEYALDDASGRVVEVATGKDAIAVWEKMSKSKYNGVDPEHIRSKHGADVTRLVVLFKAPPAHELEWDEADLAGQSRWLLRIWNLLDQAITASSATATAVTTQEHEEHELRLQLHGTIQRVTEALDQHQSFNVAIAELMKLSNALQDFRALNGTCVYREALEALVKMLAPLAPHSAAEMFERLATAGLTSESSIGDVDVDVHETSWPQFDAALLASAQVKIVLQVSGKSRDTVLVAAEQQHDQDHVLALALASSAVQKHLQGKTVRKAILIPPKKQGAHGLLNIVAN